MHRASSMHYFLVLNVFFRLKLRPKVKPKAIINRAWLGYRCYTKFQFSGNWYTHLILIYLNRQHYDRAEVYLKTLLSVVSCGSDGTQRADYHPSMFVKVYPALMNRMIVSLLRCDAHESEMLLTAFANLLRTYRHACARYPEVRRINDEHVVKFCRSSARRHKTWTNDLGELLFKMAALDTNAHPSCTMDNPQVKMDFMKEFFARQVHWV